MAAFFHTFKSVGGWTANHMMLLFGCTAGGFGLFVLFFYGYRLLPQMIDNGELDGYLTQPKPILLSIGGTRTDASGFGELLSTAILCGMAWPLTSQHLWLVISLVLLSGIFWASIALILGSASFWARDMGDWAGDMLNNFIIIATNPTNIYHGIFRLMIFTIIPVACLAYLPIEYMATNEISLLLYALAGIASIAGFSVWIFHRGLKRYESGNRFGVKG